MNIITVPKKLANKDDLVILPRKEYEALIELKKIREFTPTAAQKKSLVRARVNRKAGSYLTIDELREKLDFTN